jgi:ferritin-like metal-binding protein YciE
MGQIGTPRELFFAKLGDILYVEQALEEALPQLADEASDEELRKGLEQHLEQTRGHSRNVEEVFRMLGQNPEPKECAGFEGLKAEHEEMAGEVEDRLLDSVVAGSAAATEHYEISAYESLISKARALGESDAVGLLEKNLKEEKETLREVESISKRLAKESAKQMAQAS